MLTAQDLNQKVIANRLGDLLKLKEKEPPKITVETVNTIGPPAVDPSRNVLVSSEEALPLDTHPNGFRRTSRPETYSGDNSYLNKLPKEPETVKFPVQIPRGDKAEVIIPQTLPINNPPPAQKPSKQTEHKSTNGTIPVMQRIVDKNGKSIFLADVEVIDRSTTEVCFKTRTNGAGKWMASLPIGEYTVVFRKRDALTKEPLELTQNVQVDGSKSPLELPVCIIKN